LHVWGSFADIAQGEAPPSTFYEPWGIAIGPDGSVYVADTWNHRIQKFTAKGEFIKMWGYFGQAEQPDGFWGRVCRRRRRAGTRLTQAINGS
jgi:sugar lactone lactonase YvrE